MPPYTSTPKNINQPFATNPTAYTKAKEDSEEEARMTAGGVACVCLLIFLIIALAISFGTRGYYETHDNTYDYHHRRYYTNSGNYAQWGGG